MPAANICSRIEASATYHIVCRSSVYTLVYVLCVACPRHLCVCAVWCLVLGSFVSVGLICLGFVSPLCDSLADMHSQHQAVQAVSAQCFLLPPVLVVRHISNEMATFLRGLLKLSSIQISPVSSAG